MMKWRVALSAFLLIAAGAGCTSGPFAAMTTESLAKVPLTIRTATGDRSFTVEIARSGEEQQRGMMFRENMAANAGMIFPMEPPRMASFWMKNTLIPLDMIFVRSDGTIARIAPDTVPQSLEPVSSGEPIAAVLEIAGGQAAKQGIGEGDRVIWRDPQGK